MVDNLRPPATGYPAAPGYPPSTGYPYLRPPQPYYPNTYPRATVSRRIFAIFLAFTAVIISVIFIVYFLIRPHPPIFHVSSVTLSNFNISSSPSLITGNWDVMLTSQNPNSKITLRYEKIDALLSYNTAVISQTALPPLDQGTKNLTAVKATFVAAGAYVEKWVVDDISKDMSRKSVGFNVKLVAVVRFKGHWIWRHRSQWVRVYCRDLDVGLTAGAGNASLVDKGERQCRVGM